VMVEWLETNRPW